MISNPGLPHENPVLSQSHRYRLTLTNSDSPDDIVHYGLARKHKKYRTARLSCKFTSFSRVQAISMEMLGFEANL